MPRTKETDETRRLRHERDADLVKRIRGGDQSAFEEYVETYKARVYSMIRGTLRNREEADDIAQQVFAKAWLAIGSFDHRGSLLTWTWRITVNECFDYLRKKRVRKLSYQSEYSEEDW